MELYRIQWSDEVCLDKCKCGGTPFTLELSKFVTKCDSDTCTMSVSGKTYVDIMVKWNKAQRK